jgi:hypothetical protein
MGEQICDLAEYQWHARWSKLEGTYTSGIEIKQSKTFQPKRRRRSYSRTCGHAAS